MVERKAKASASSMRWALLTNHALVALLIAENPRILLRVVAEQIGITERAVQRIVADLEESGYLRRQRVGRSNWYQLALDTPIHHRAGRRTTLRQLVALFGIRSQKHPLQETDGKAAAAISKRKTLRKNR